MLGKNNITPTPVYSPFESPPLQGRAEFTGTIQSQMSVSLVCQLFLNTGDYDAPSSSSSLILVPLVQHEHVVLGDPRPALAVDVIQVDLPAAVGVAVRGLVYGAAA